MSVYSTRFDFVEQSLGLFDIETQTIAHEFPKHEARKDDDDEAMFCSAFEDLLKQALHLYERIACLLHTEWHLADNIEDDHYDQRLEWTLRKWHKATERVKSLYALVETEYEARGFDSGKVRTLFSNIDEAARQLEDRDLRREIARITPSNSDMLLLAQNSPPSAEWFADDSLSPASTESEARGRHLHDDD